MQGIWDWIVANPAAAAAAAVAIFAFATGRLTLGGLLAAIMDAFKRPGPVTPPVTDPTVPPVTPPGPANWLTMIQMIVALITQARAKGDKAEEEAALKLLDSLQSSQYSR